MDSTYTYFYRALELLRSDKPEAEKEIEQLLEKSKELFKNGKNGNGYKHKLTDNKHILGERFGQNSLTRSQLSKAAVALNQSREKKQTLVGTKRKLTEELKEKRVTKKTKTKEIEIQPVQQNGKKVLRRTRKAKA